MFNFIKKTFKVFILLLIAESLFSQTDHDQECFSILAGKNATADNSVFFAHNEDNYGKNVFNFYRVPAMEHERRQDLLTDTELKIRQARNTHSYLWIAMPMRKFSDAYMNERGVTIASNQCLSKEDKPDLVDGGIGFWLRRIMAERAESAREAVEIAGKLIEKYGYNASGRTYSIADPNEVWMLAVVNGKQWVAQRVPEDHAAVISNCYTIGEVNLKDKENFLGNKNLIKYAIKRAWYDPASGLPFNFKKAYAEEGSLDSDGNKPRQLAAINFLADREYSLDDDLPFSFRPAQKVTKERLMYILANHFENTGIIDEEDIRGNPHNCKYSTICASSTQYGFVAELRSDMPVEIGNLMWIAMRRPCIQPFVPIYFGVDQFPLGFTYENHEVALQEHFWEIDREALMSNNAYWIYDELAEGIDNYYTNLSATLKESKQEFENDVLGDQSLFESNYQALYYVNKDAARDYINSYISNLLVKNAVNATRFLETVRSFDKN